MGFKSDEVARAKREWERTVDSLPELVCLVDQNGNIVRANRTIETWRLGDVSRLRGVHVHSLLHRDCDDTSCALRDAVSVSKAAQASKGFLESVISDSTLGRELKVRTRVIDDLPVREGEQSRPCAVIAISDISALHKAQQDLASCNERLEQRVQARTEELQQANIGLAEEVQRRRSVERELQVSRDELAELTEQLINSQEDERQRLSRELHDSLGQSLGAIKYSLERVAALLNNTDQGDPAQEITAIIDSIGRAIQETRSIAVSLRPPVLDDIGTASAIGWLCQNFAATYSDICFHFEIGVADSDIPKELATPAYRITQEALNNIVKHSGAAKVDFAARLSDDVLRIEVVDDGVGFDNRPDATGNFESLGKIGRLGMRERALNSNGVLNIESRRGDGTRVTVEWLLIDTKKTSERIR